LNIGVICHCERSIAEAGSNLTDRKISSELAYAFGIPLRRYAPRNDGKELAIGAIGEICGCSQFFFAIIKPPGHKRSDRAAKGTAAL